MRSDSVRTQRARVRINQVTAFSHTSQASQPTGGQAEKGRLRGMGLMKTYQMRTVVAGFDLEVEQGEVFGLLGPNGAGKTTLMSMITGLVTPDAGRVEIDGIDVSAWPLHRRARLGLSYLPQESSVFAGLSVADNIMFYLEAVEPDPEERRARLEVFLGAFDLKPLRDRIASRLSGGQRRRCEIARALAGQPRYLVLDEPFAGVDPLAIAELQHTIVWLRNHGLGVLISDHNVRETLSIVDRAYIMVDGQMLASGSPAAIKADDQVRDHYLGTLFDT